MLTATTTAQQFVKTRMKYVTVLTECASQLDRKSINLFGSETHQKFSGRKKNPRDIHTSVAVLVATTTTTTTTKSTIIGTNIKDTSNNNAEISTTAENTKKHQPSRKNSNHNNTTSIAAKK
jgi:hypothetical protein